MTRARNLANRASDTVSVKDSPFGAVGDGVTNDSDAVQMAINKIATFGRGVVVFPPGYTYYLNSQINLCDNLVLWGYGAKIKVGTGFAGINNPLFKNFSGTSFTAPGTRLASQNIAFLGFEVDGGDTGVTASTVPNANMHGVIICVGGWTASSGVTGFVVQDCYMHDFAGAGVMAWKSSEITVSKNRFRNFFTNTSLSVGSPIDCHEVSRVNICNNQINHTASGYSWHGMVVLDWDAGSSEVVIADNVITNMNYGDGISCEGNTANNLSNATITGNVIKNCTGQGIGIDNCVSAIVSNNVIDTVTGPGILFTATEDVVAVGNSITTCGLGGITCSSGVVRAVIANNKIVGITYFNATFRGEGINVSDGSFGNFQQINIVGNTIKDTAGSGIYAVGYNCTVQANNIYNTGTSSSLAATLRAGICGTAYSLVSNNYIRSAGNTHYAISSAASDFPSIESNRIYGTFLTNFYYIAYRGTGIYHNISVDIEDAKYDARTNTFTGRYNGTPAGYWYRGDTFYATLPASAGYIGSVVTTTPSTWKTFGVIS